MSYVPGQVLILMMNSEEKGVLSVETLRCREWGVYPLLLGLLRVTINPAWQKSQSHEV